MKCSLDPLLPGGGGATEMNKATLKGLVVCPGGLWGLRVAGEPGGWSPELQGGPAADEEAGGAFWRAF